MRACELFCGTGITFSDEIEICGITCDSRRVEEGYLFICHSGGRYDGHEFAREAKDKGATLILGEHSVDGVDNMILTPSTRECESHLWNNFTGRPIDKMTKIAVTGTAGKTSVTFLLRHILASSGRRVGVISTVGVYAQNEALDVGENGGSSVSDISGAMTTPDPEYFFKSAAKMRDAGCDTLVFEASSQAIAMGRLHAVTPDIAVYTNLSSEHLDYHLTMENYFFAKSSLMKKTPCAVINADDEWISQLPGKFPEKKFIRVSTSGRDLSDFDALALKYTSLGPDGVEYIYYSRDAVFGIRSPLSGKYSVYNTMEAAACALYLGCDPMTVKAAMSDFCGVPGRLQRVRFPKLRREDLGGELPAFFIDYAHTPKSLEAVLLTLREITEGRLIVLFGCGGDRDRTKRPMMASVALVIADHTIITSDNSRSEDPGRIIDDILRGVDGEKSFTVIVDRREAIKYAAEISRAGDVVLLAGKGHEKYEINAAGRHIFDEEALVCEAVYSKYKQDKKKI